MPGGCTGSTVRSSTPADTYRLRPAITHLPPYALPFANLPAHILPVAIPAYNHTLLHFI